MIDQNENAAIESLKRCRKLLYQDEAQGQLLPVIPDKTWSKCFTAGGTEGKFTHKCQLLLLKTGILTKWMILYFPLCRGGWKDTLHEARLWPEIKVRRKQRNLFMLVYNEQVTKTRFCLGYLLASHIQCSSQASLTSKVLPKTAYR